MIQLPERINGDTRFKIEFKRPDLESLTQTGTVVDPHFHTVYSDGTNTVKSIAMRAARLGIGVGITDHNEIRGAIEMDAIKDVLSIPGIEVTSAEGSHLLAYFEDVERLRQFFFDDIRPAMGPDVMSSTALPMEDVIRRAKSHGAVVIFPHPFSAAYTGVCNPYFPAERLQALFEAVDGVEAINASNMNKWNLQCAVLGFNLNKAVIGGSDGHRLSQMGKAVTCAECEPTRAAFLSAMMAGRTRAVGKEIDIIRKMTAHTIKLRSTWKNAPDMLEKNIRYSYTLFNSRSRSFKENVKRTFNGKKPSKS